MEECKWLQSPRSSIRTPWRYVDDSWSCRICTEGTDLHTRHLRSKPRLTWFSLLQIGQYQASEGPSTFFCSIANPFMQDSISSAPQLIEYAHDSNADKFVSLQSKTSDLQDWMALKRWQPHRCDFRLRRLKHARSKQCPPAISV